MNRPFGRGPTTLLRGLTITMVINHLRLSWDDPPSSHFVGIQGLVLLRDLWFRLDRSGEGASFLLSFPTNHKNCHPGSQGYSPPPWNQVLIMPMIEGQWWLRIRQIRPTYFLGGHSGMGNFAGGLGILQPLWFPKASSSATSTFLKLTSW